MFDYFKKIAISNRADDELLYEYVLDFLQNLSSRIKTFIPINQSTDKIKA